MLDPRGGPARVSLLWPAPDALPLFDDPAVCAARRRTRGLPAPRATSTLTVDSTHFAGSLWVPGPGGRLDDDPFRLLGAPLLLQVGPGLVGTGRLLIGPAQERYAGAPWPSGRFAAIGDSQARRNDALRPRHWLPCPTRGCTDRGVTVVPSPRAERRVTPLRAALAAVLTLPALVLVTSTASGSTPPAAPSRATGPVSGLLPVSKLTVSSTVQVDLDDQSVRLPLHRGTFRGTTVWYVLTDASDAGVADELGLNYAPKLGNAAIGCPACVQEVTLAAPSGNVFGEGIVSFAGIPDFSPRRVLTAGAGGFPPATAVPGAVGGKGYSPFIRVAGSSTVYNAPVVAVGDGPFDVEHHGNTADRVLAVHPAPPPTGPAQFHGASVDLLFVRGFDSGKPIVYLSFESDDPTTAVLERATYVPALSGAPYAGGDDFLGSLRERIFPFVNGQTGSGNPQAQGLAHLVVDGHAGEDASLSNRPLLDALRLGGDALNVQGDFPTLEEPNRRASYSPLWEAQFGEWTAKAVRTGQNTRQTDEFQILALAKDHPDLLTGPGGAPYGSVKALINCPVIAYLAQEPTADLIAPEPGIAADFRGSYARR